MTAQPQWSDSGQGDLLELIALGTPASPSAEEEWDAWQIAARAVALSDPDGIIRPNELRPLTRGIASQRRGAFTNRALSQGLVEYTGDWQVSDDHAGRNGGKPARLMRWLGRTT